MAPQQHLLLLLLQSLLILSSPLLSVVFSDLAADTTSLLRLREALRGRTLRWNTTSPTPCQWEGVTCGPTINRVTAIRLPGDGLSGQLPENTIGNLTQLRVLSLRHNSLSGPIPSDIGLCIELQNINLENNQFSGDIPDDLFILSNLSRLNLANNRFSGQISTSFNNFSQLRTLYLQENQFNGSIPSLDSLSDLQQFNVSFNNLSGLIPQRLNQFPSNSFLGNPLCGVPLEPCVQSNGGGGGGGGGGSNLSGGAIAGIVIGSFFGLIFLLLILFLLWRKFKRKDQSGLVEMPPFPSSRVKPPEFDFRNSNGSSKGLSSRTSSREKTEIKEVSNGNGNGNGGLVFLGDNIRGFGLEELLRASAEVLGKGVLGTTYKAHLETGDNVVVKRLRNVCVSEKEFKERVEKLGSLNHKNLVPLRAYFFGEDEKLLVFESFPFGSLHSILHGPDRTSLTWIIRCRIALGTATALQYLQSHGSNIIHGNIKSSNILLNQYYDPCLSEYSIADLVSTITPASYLLGYRAPELVDSRNATQKADVYSFGVLLLELLTGKGPKTALDEDAIDLPKLVKSAFHERRTIEVFDAELVRHHRNYEEQMVQLLQLAISCTFHVPEKRPLISNVTRRIRDICGLQEGSD